jgi:hypothetical protein
MSYANGGVLRLAPLGGGLPPEVAWPYRERAPEVAQWVAVTPPSATTA